MQGTITAAAVRTFIPARSLLQDILPGEIVEYSLGSDKQSAFQVWYMGIPIAYHIPLGEQGIIPLQEREEWS